MTSFVPVQTLTEQETAANQARLYAALTEDAWQAWVEASCLEWNGQHLWLLDIDCGSASVRCASCKAEPYPDCNEVLCGQFPVTIDVTVDKHDVPGYPIEYDVWVEVTPR
jgi:hypothetical protein